jgi:hypothetical protein
LRLRSKGFKLNNRLSRARQLSVTPTEQKSDSYKILLPSPNLTNVFYLEIILIEIEFQFLLLINMQPNTAIEFLPSINEDKKIDVLIKDDTAVIKLSTFTEGLGWSCQKTMALEGSLLDDLHRAISAARYRINSFKSEKNVVNDSNVIQFPGVS